MPHCHAAAGGESAAQLKKRAETLRTSADRARHLAKKVGTFLDGAVKQTGSDTWLGPYANTTTDTLKQRQGSLSRVAGALRAEAKRWDREAHDLEERASKAQHKAGAH